MIVQTKSAEEIHDHLNSGESVCLNDTEIEGDLVLEHIDITAPFTAKSCRFLGKVSFNHASFKYYLLLSSCEFLSDISLQCCSFRRGLNIFKSDVRGSFRFNFSSSNELASFTENRVSGPASFSGFRCSSTMLLYNTEFHDASDFTGLEIHGSLEAEKAQFYGPMKSWGGAVDQDANFVKTIFHDGADFQGSKYRKISFDDAVFKKEAVFKGVKIGSYASFCKAQFQNTANFDGLFVGGETHFREAHFKASCDLKSARIQGSLNMKHSKFIGSANFDNIQVDQVLFLNGAIFGRTFGLSHASILGGAEFHNTVFEGDAEFAATSIGRETILLGTKFFGNVGFGNTDFEAIALTEPEVMISGRVQLQGCKFNTVKGYTAWLKLMPKMVKFSRQPYKQLEQALLNEGEDFLADRVYYEGKKKEFSHLSWKDPFRKCLGYLLYWLTGFGVKRYRLALLMVAILVCATVLFSKPGAVEGIGVVDSELNLLDSFLFSLDTFLPIDLPTGIQCSGSHKKLLFFDYRLLAVFLSAIGWITVPIGIAASTGLLRRH